MKTKIIYVVTCSEKNTYLEQALLSVYSARIHNPAAEIYVVTDSESADGITGIRSEIKKYLTDILVFDTPDGFNAMKKSRYLKTNLRELIKGDFIYIDTDTVICQPLDEVDEIEEDVSGVANRHLIYKVSEMKEANSTFRKLDVEVKEDFVYINGGMLIAKDTPTAHKLFKAWYDSWIFAGTKGIFMDQAALHRAEIISGYKIHELSGVWNCQIEGCCLNYLHDAKILHFYAVGGSGKTSAYLLRQDSIYDKIKADGKLSDDIKALISKPHQSFSPGSSIVSDTKRKFLFEANPLFLVYRDHPRLWKILFFPFKLAFRSYTHKK